jgi:chemotaxis protein CheX
MSMLAATNGAAQTAEYVNPIIRATRDVFEMMLGCTPRRTGLKFKGCEPSPYSVSGVIGIAGKAVGSIAVCLTAQQACEMYRRVSGTETEKVNDDVCDAVGVLTNMIAGAAKTQLEHMELSVGLPNVIQGESLIVHYPAEVKPFCVLFDSELGPFMIEVGFSQTAT